MQNHEYSPANDQTVVSLWIRCELTQLWNNPQADIGGA